MAAFDLPANDPRLSAIFHHDPEGMRSAIERARVASTSMPPTPISEPDPERFVDFISSVPPIVTCLLVELAPFLSRLRWALQVVSWRTGSYPDSWLALAAFWAICLWLSFTVRYFLPILLLLPYISSTLWSRIHSPKGIAPDDNEQTSTEATLQVALADLTTIHHLLPSLPPLRSFNVPTVSIIRLSVVGYTVYAALIFIFPPNSTIAIIGTFLFTWRAPWARTTRNIIISNGWVRYLSKKAWGGLIGISPAPGPESPTVSRSAPGTASLTDKSAGIKSTEFDSLFQTDIPPPFRMRFRFTVLENQRWWVGLDWTAALLPQERASWTSAFPALKPVPPPMAIGLPSTTSIYLPLSVKGKEGLRMKRTASWSWVDLAWAVVVRLDNASQPERVVMALPKVDPAAVAESGVSGASSPGPEGLLQRGLQKIGTVDLGMGGPSRSSPTSRIASSSYGTGHLRSTSPESTRRVRRASEDAATAVDDHWDHERPSHAGDVPLAKEGEECGVTDAEGWTYGDNKWEGAGSKNGIGKFTRFRRWTRVVLLTETVEIVPATDDPHYIRVPSSTSPPSTIRQPPRSSPTQAMKALPSAPVLAADIPVTPAVNTVADLGSGNSPTKSGGSALRQRLQRAVDTRI